MTTIATVRGLGQLDDATAARIADLWNQAYPGMRETLTLVISRHRDYLQTAEHAGNLTAEMEASTRRYIKRLEETRRVLGQLDRGTHRGCTRSPGAFSTSAALSAVQRALEAFSVGGPALGDVYRLAATLADEEAAKAARWQAEHSNV
ncbi:hypothetical protein QR97_16835 [Streptomyces sp. PBH53]|uniref:hypothetical protein n=1 Tax=Streptomyces sp. PBH53 TaxID=1577075 RepID=UPI0006562593|nr:hypothetical protein [Streptomyces sp. PBH53]AKN71248.1 hypothetical protein QR97_16835 [Streptomyces sp. PBH53]